MTGTFSEFVYTRPDLADLACRCRQLADEIAAADSYETVRAALLTCKTAQAEMMTMRSIASVRNTVDTRDPFYEAEVGYFNAETPKLALELKKVNEALLASPFRKELEGEFGSLFFHNMDVQKQFADQRIIPAQVRVSQLTQEYSKVTALASTKFRGEDCNFYGLLKHMQSTDRALRKEAFEAWADLYAGIADRLDAIYDEMVQLRDGMAKTLGFASYTDMAYLQRRRYDYTAEDAASFRRQIREVITPAVHKLFLQQQERLGVEKLCYYDEALTYPEGNPIPQGTRDELVAKAQQMYREMSAETGEFFDTMVTHQLFDLETKPGKRGGGYCTGFPSLKLPFIFSNFNGTSADVDVLTHEAGHAFQAYLAARVQPFTDLASSTSEINEIHSMTMEHFAYPWMDLFFGEEKDKYLYSHLMGTLTVLPYMAAVDEYQHRVYEAPGMTAMERRGVWRELERVYMPWRDYDGNEFLEQGGFWMQKQHIFLFPFYYIEYALAQIGAFQFYDTMKTDRAKAWEDYCRLCRAGGSVGYFALLELAGLDNPFRPGTVEKAVAGVLEELGL